MPKLNQTDPDNDPAFPCLDAGELAATTSCGTTQMLETGNLLFATGDAPLDCCVVIKGSIGIFDRSTKVERQVATHTAGGFTGDIGLLAGRPALADARALIPSEIVRLNTDQLRRLLTICPSIGEKWIPALIRRRALLLERGHEGLHVFGKSDDAATLRVCEFLFRNGVPHRWRDLAESEAQTDISALVPGAVPSLPLIAMSSVVKATNPSLEELGRLTGVLRPLPSGLFDVAIIGAGPAGLGAAVYAASEGMRALVLDALGPGGQAGSSSRIENYAGFPEGISGRDLALRSYIQALKFGAEFGVPRAVVSIVPRAGGGHSVLLTDGGTVATKAVIIATGVSYRFLPVPGLAQFVGVGVFYAATQMEAQRCRGMPIHVIGAGNSAGQAAMYLSRFTDRVNLMVRGGNIYDSMSDYLADRLVSNSRVSIRLHSEMRSVAGRRSLETITVEDKKSGLKQEEASGGVFVFIGAMPSTSFLGPAIARDPAGYLLTGTNVPDSSWPLKDRKPLPLETSIPGIMAAGDCRIGSTKRVAFAVGDGALSVTCLHEFFGT